MTSKQFLLYGGVVLLLLGIIGFILPNGELLGKALYFDSGENWAHTILGIVAIVASYVLGASAQRSLVAIVGVVALFFGIWGFIVAGKAAPNFYGVTNLEFLDNIVHLAVAVWAYLSMRGDQAMVRAS
jgi:hypothetical protein